MSNTQPGNGYPPSSSMPLISAPPPGLIECNQQLKALGIGNTIQLPQICVIGDQSAGKSSLIQALSEIEVPKAAGCCTQCPLQINLSGGEGPDSPWKCVISLVMQYDYDANTRSKKPTIKQPLGPWIERHDNLQVHFFTTSNKRDVCELIKYAQLAILNPQKDYNLWVPREGIEILETWEVKFSPNIVKLDISQGGWHSLSFIDLPGVIANAGNNARDERYLVPLVTNLVTKYVRQKGNISLLTMPMNNDIANSLAMGIIQDEKAHCRTVAVLTKSDRVSDDKSLEPFLELLSNTSDSTESCLKYGYYAVMMGPAASHAEAIENESKFFAKPDSPWQALQPAFQQRLGVQALAQSLQLILHEQTRDKLPSIQKSIKDRLQDIDNQLVALPPPPDVHTLPNTVLNLINQFAENARNLFGSGNATFPLLSKWDRLAEEFRDTVIGAFPRIVLRSESDRNKLRKVLNSGSSTISTTNSRKLTGELEDGGVISDDDRNATPMKKESNRETNKKSDIFQRFTFEDIRELNRKHARGGMPRLKFPAAIHEMQQLSVSQWQIPVRDLMHSTEYLVHEQLQKSISDVFGGYVRFPIYQAVFEHVFEVFSAVFDAQKALLSDNVDVQQAVPYTLDGESLSRKSRKIHAELLERRLESRLGLERSIHEATQTTDGVRAGRATKFTTTKDDLSDDEFDTELEMLADVRAYYQIASTRFVDVVCQSVYAHLFAKCSQSLGEQVKDFLGPMDPQKHERIAEWMTEDPERLRQRKKLFNERVKLVAAQELVERVLGDGNADMQAYNTKGEMLPPTTPSRGLAERDRESSTASGKRGLMTVDGPESSQGLCSPEESPTKRMRTGFAGTKLD